MSYESRNGRITFVASNPSAEQVKSAHPRKSMANAGEKLVLIASKANQVQALNDDEEKSIALTAGFALGYVKTEGLAILGDAIHADHVQMSKVPFALVKSLVGADQPVVSIRRGPWALVEARALQGQTLTSLLGLATDVHNAGGTWVDEEVLVCPTNGWNLTTSRSADDLDAFCSILVQRPAEATR